MEQWWHIWKDSHLFIYLFGCEHGREFAVPDVVSLNTWINTFFIIWDWAQASRKYFPLCLICLLTPCSGLLAQGGVLSKRDSVTANALACYAADPGSIPDDLHLSNKKWVVRFRVWRICRVGIDCGKIERSNFFKQSNLTTSHGHKVNKTKPKTSWLHKLLITAVTAQ